MSDHYELTLSDFLTIARRHWLALVAPFLVIFSASVVIALWTPPVYKSSGTILIESQQIPTDLIRSTVTTYADERIQIIQQLVMTRQNLMRIIEKFNLLAKVKADLSMSEQINLMHNKIEIQKLAGEISPARGQNSALIAFTVSFEDGSPVLAHAVSNELVTLFLEENVRTRTKRASETTEFLTEEAGKLKQDLELIEEQIASYKQENSKALPEHLDLHMAMLERTEIGIKNVERDIKSAEEEIRFLEIELSAINAGAISSTEPLTIATPKQTLASAEAELVALQSRYSDKHPDIKRLQDQIAKLKVKAAEAGPAGPTVDNVLTTQNIDTSRVQAKIASVNERIRSLIAQEAQLVSKRNALEEVIIQTPQIQRSLVSLNRDYENTKAKYTEIQAKEMEAKLAESLEEGKKAERFSLLEPPALPEMPIKPNRSKIMAMGFFLAIGASLGLTTLLEAGDKRIRGVNALSALLNERPLVAIPYITTEDELQRHRRNRKWLIAGAILTGLVLLAGIHIFYMPLDLLLIKVMARLG